MGNSGDWRSVAVTGQTRGSDLKKYYGIRIKRIVAILLTAVFTCSLVIAAYAAEVTGGRTTTPATTTAPNTAATTATGSPYAPTGANVGNLNPRLGDSAINASIASKVKAVGEPHSVAGITKNQLYTMRASKVLELLTGDYSVYDKTGHKLGTAKEMFNGVWDDIDPAKVMNRTDGLGGNKGTPYNTNPGNLTLESVSKSWIKLDIPSNAVYANIENVPGNSGGKLVELKSLSVKKWNYAARYCEIYDKERKRITFTRENGETY